MPRPIPTLGYPTRTAAVLALDGRGLTPAEIAQEIGDGVTANAVRVTLCHVRTSRRRTYATERTVRFPVDILDRLKLDADARGISVNELTRRLINHIVDDGLVDGILDDGAELADG